MQFLWSSTDSQKWCTSYRPSQSLQHLMWPAFIATTSLCTMAIPRILSQIATADSTANSGVICKLNSESTAVCRQLTTHKQMGKQSAQIAFLRTCCAILLTPFKITGMSICRVHNSLSTTPTRSPSKQRLLGSTLVVIHKHPYRGVSRISLLKI